MEDEKKDSENINIPRDEEQIAAEEGRTTQAQLDANRKLEEQIQEREDRDKKASEVFEEMLRAEAAKRGKGNSEGAKGPIREHIERAARERQAAPGEPPFIEEMRQQISSDDSKENSGVRGVLKKLFGRK